jgi:hypothetical protein
MYKKIGVLILFILLTVNAVHAQSPGIDRESLENDSVVRGVRDLQEFTEEKKWEYLSEQWKDLLLKSETISTIDSGLRKISIVFFIIFGMDYDLSLTFIFVILFWIFFLVMFNRSIEGFSTFSKGVSFSLAVIFTVILAHLKLYSALATLAFKVIFFREGVWSWISLAIFLIGWLFFVVFMKKLIWQIGRKFKKTQEEKEKWDEKFQRELIRKEMQSMQKAFDTVNEGFTK